MKIEEPAFYRSKITDWPEGERPREKLMKLGAENLSDSELIAILLRTGSTTHTAVDLAKTLLTRHGGLQELSQLDYQAFFHLKGMGPAKAITLAAAFELGRRISSRDLPAKLKIDSPEKVFKRFAPLLSHLKKEVFMLLILNSANLLIKDVRISEGTLNSSLVHPREVFKPAILESAASVILLHNHPSGEVLPSLEDKNITARLVEVGKLLDIPVLDHLIIGNNKYFSFKEEGIISD